MTQRKIPAVYMRGGTSRCLVFHERDLPAPGPARDAILLSALGSPDPNGRQLDGLGGGISSTTALEGSTEQQQFLTPWGSTLIIDGRQ